jgi:hypothetical protein
LLPVEGLKVARIGHVSESPATGVLSVLSTLVHGQVRDGRDVTLCFLRVPSTTTQREIPVLCPFDERAWTYHVSRGRTLG